MADDLEKAILFMFDESGRVEAQLKAQAGAFLEGSKGRTDSWHLCAKYFESSGYVEVKFWCLQTLVDLLRSSEKETAIPWEGRAQLRAALLTWIDHDCSTAAWPQYIKGKLVQLVYIHIALDFPKEWPTVFQDLMKLVRARGSAAVMYLCKVLDALYEELISLEYPRSKEEYARAAVVKDAMREICIGELFSTMFTIIHSSSRETNPEITSMCLLCFAQHVSWADIALSASEEAIASLTELLSKTQHENIREGVYCFFRSIVTKSMGCDAKMALLEQLKIAQMAYQGSNKLNDSWASLLASSCSEVLGCIKEMQSDEQLKMRTNVVLGQLMDCLVKQLNPQNCVEAIMSVLNFISEYSSYIYKEKVVEEYSHSLSSFLPGVASCCQLTDFESIYVLGGDKGLVDIATDEMRNEVIIVFRNLVRIVPAVCASHVHSMIEDALSRGQSCSAVEMENCIRLLYELGEGSQGEWTKPYYGVLYKPAMMLLSGASAIPHQTEPAIALSFLETSVRYYRMLEIDKEKIPGVLNAFMGDRGIRHQSDYVSGRASYLLVRFCRYLKPHLGPYASMMINALGEPMEICITKPRTATQTTANLTSHAASAKDPRLYVFDVMGILLGGTDSAIIPPNEQLTFFATFVGQLRNAMEKALESTSIHSAGDRRNQIDSICIILGAGGQLFSGTSEGMTESSRANLCDLTKDFVAQVQMTLLRFQDDAIFRSRIGTFLHRIISSFGAAAVPLTVPMLPLLFSVPEAGSRTEVMLLLCQIIVKLKGDAEQLFVEFVLTALAELATVLGQLNASSSEGEGLGITTTTIEERREVWEMQQTFFQVIQTATSNGLTQAFLDRRLHQHLENILRLLVAGVTLHPWTASKKMCLLALGRFAIAYEGDAEDVGYRRIQGFKNFLIDSVGWKVGLALVFEKIIDPRDADTVNTYTDIAASQSTLVRIFGNEYLNHVCTVLLPRTGVGTETIQHFAVTLSSGDSGKIKGALRQIGKGL